MALPFEEAGIIGGVARGWTSLGWWCARECAGFGPLFLAVLVAGYFDRSRFELWITVGPHAVGLVYLILAERARLVEAIRPGWRPAGWGIAAGGAMIAAGTGYAGVLDAFGVPYPDMSRWLHGVVPFPPALLLWGAVLVPIVEEGWFRGRFADAVRARLDVRFAFVLSAAVFTVVHGLPQFAPVYFVFAAILFALRERTGSLLAPIVAHAVNNAWGLIVG